MKLKMVVMIVFVLLMSTLDVVECVNLRESLVLSKSRMTPGQEMTQTVVQKRAEHAARAGETKPGDMETGETEEGHKVEIQNGDAVCALQDDVSLATVPGCDEEDQDDGEEDETIRIRFEIREHGTDHELSATEETTIKRYYRMNRAQLTLKLRLDNPGAVERNIVVLAFLEDKIVGFCQIVMLGYHDDERWYIWNLMRRKQYLQAQSNVQAIAKKVTAGRYGAGSTPADLRGVGSRLLTQAENLVRKEAGDGTKLNLDIKSKYSRTLQPYYTRHGYECTNCDLWFKQNVFHFHKIL
jgi:hypothetical protein